MSDFREINSGSKHEAQAEFYGFHFKNKYKKASRSVVRHFFNKQGEVKGKHCKLKLDK